MLQNVISLHLVGCLALSQLVGCAFSCSVTYEPFWAINYETFFFFILINLWNIIDINKELELNKGGSQRSDMQCMNKGIYS